MKRRAAVAALVVPCRWPLALAAPAHQGGRATTGHARTGVGVHGHLRTSHAGRGRRQLHRPLLRGGVLRLPPDLLQRHGQLLPGREQRRHKRHPAEHGRLRRLRDPDGGQGPGQGQGDRCCRSRSTWAVSPSATTSRGRPRASSSTARPWPAIFEGVITNWDSPAHRHRDRATPTCPTCRSCPSTGPIPRGRAGTSTTT